LGLIGLKMAERLEGAMISAIERIGAALETEKRLFPAGKDVAQHVIFGLVGTLFPQFDALVPHLGLDAAQPAEQPLIVDQGVD
jgi:hypothetical protein